MKRVLWIGLTVCILLAAIFSTALAQENKEVVAKQYIPSGVYYISAASNTSIVFDVYGSSFSDGAKVTFFKKGIQSNQQFMVTHMGSDYYQIRSVHSGKSLDVPGASTAKGVQIQQWGYNGSNAQLFKLIRVSLLDYNSYYINPKCTSMYLDAKSGVIASGTPIQTWTSNGTAAQKFKFTKVADKDIVPGTPTITSVSAPRADGVSKTTVKWYSVFSADQYELTICDAAGAVVSQNRTTLAYGLSSKSLPRGTYTAQVRSISNKSGRSASSSKVTFVINDPDIRLNVNVYRQTTNYTCSAATSLTVLRYRNVAPNLTDLQYYEQKLGSNTSPYYICKALNTYLPNTFVYSDWGTVDTNEKYYQLVRKSLIAGYPVIAQIKIPDKTYFTYTSNGHYVVICGLSIDGSTYAVLKDPYVSRFPANKYCDPQTDTVKVPLSILRTYGTYGGTRPSYLVYKKP